MNALIVQGRSNRRSWMLGAALAALAIATPACNLYTSQPTRGPAHSVEVAGVVVSQRVGVEGSRGYTEFALENGQVYRVYGDAHGPAPVEGWLLLAGSAPSPWVDRAGPEDPKSWPAGCYGYNENGYNRATTVELDNGLTLQKTADFTWPASANRDNRISGEALCLNKQGQVFTIVG